MFFRWLVNCSFRSVRPIVSRRGMHLSWNNVSSNCMVWLGKTALFPFSAPEQLDFLEAWIQQGANSLRWDPATFWSNCILFKHHIRFERWTTGHCVPYLLYTKRHGVLPIHFMLVRSSLLHWAVALHTRIVGLSLCYTLWLKHKASTIIDTYVILKKHV